MIKALNNQSPALVRNFVSKRRSKNVTFYFFKSNVILALLVASLVFISCLHFFWFVNGEAFSNSLLDEITNFHVRSSARSSARGLSSDLRDLFESLEYPKSDYELSEREIVKYFVHAFSQLALNSKGSFYQHPEHTKDKFNEHYSCRSRKERLKFYRSHVRPPPPHLYALLYRYFEFHKNCTQELRKWNGMDLRGFQSDCNFVYFPGGDQGLGNKLLSLISTVAYAILTKRAILIDSDPFASLLCEPFPFSSWIFPLNATEVLYPHSVAMSKFLSQERCRSTVTCHYGMSFSCYETQKRLRDVQWIIMESNVYFLPELFAFPYFQSTLKEIFPRNNIFHSLSQWFLMPKDDIWQRILHLKRSYMPNADMILGMHVRYLVYKDGRHYTNHEDHIDYMNTRMDDCLLKISESLPKPKETSPNFANEDAKIKKMDKKKDKKIVVFIASQFSDAHAQHLKGLYMDGGENGEFVSVQHITATHRQLSTLEEHVQSFTEMWLLSAVDQLMISSNSTFSYIAQGLGDHHPWVLNFWPQPWEYPACFKRYTSEPCHLNATESAECLPTDYMSVDAPFEQIYSSLHTCRDRPNSLILYNFTLEG